MQIKSWKKLCCLVLVAGLCLGTAGCEGTGKNEEADRTVVQKDRNSGAGEADQKEGRSGQKKQSTEEGKKIALQDDYYSFINQDTLEKLELHYGESYGGPAADIMEMVDQEIYEVVWDVVDSGKRYSMDSGEAWVQKVCQLYLHRKDDREQIKKEFEGLAADIQDAASPKELLKILKELAEESGIISYFDMSVDRDFYQADRHAIYIEQKTSFGDFGLKDLYEKDESREMLHTFAFDALTALGEREEEAAKKADNLVYLVLDVACDTDYKVMEAENPFLTFQFHSAQELDEILKNVKRKDLEQIFGITKNPYGGCYVQDEEQLRQMDTLFCQENVETLKTYLLCDLFARYKEILADSYDFLSFYRSESYRGEQWNAAVFANDLLPEQVGELYVEKYYTKDMDMTLEKMFEDIRESYRSLIQGADWLGADTRKSMLEKLEHILLIKGGEGRHEEVDADLSFDGKDIWEVYGMLKAREHQNSLALIGTPNHRDTMGMPPQIVNGVYSTDNVFSVTPAMLHAPYYDKKADYATNLGGIGMVMAHEIGHAFDSNCIEYDQNGNYHPDWIREKDRELLKEQARQMVSYYSDFTIMDVYHVDGEKTCGENFADKGGMECLMKVVNSKQERKQVFENYAKIWCTMIEDSAAIERLLTNEHSPEQVRVNAVLASTDEFYEIYDIEPGDGMYKAPKERVNRW